MRLKTQNSVENIANILIGFLMTDWRTEWKPLAVILAVFLTAFYMPLGNARFDGALNEAFELTKWYAREHVVLCLLPAFFIAGAISVFIRKDSVMRFLGASANKAVAYGVASMSGSILAVCSCTVLPLFAGIYKRGAGIGPASAFLYSGPAVNVLAIIMTARILGFDIGFARAVSAIAFSLAIGLTMSALFNRKAGKEQPKENVASSHSESERYERPLWHTSLFFLLMIVILVFANWAKPDATEGVYAVIYSIKWIVTSLAAFALAIILVTMLRIAAWKVIGAVAAVFAAALILPANPVLAFTVGIISLSVVIGGDKGEAGEWFYASWEFAKQIFPLLLFGILLSGFLLGRPGSEGIIPSVWISSFVGGNSIFANLAASVVGAFMYFATLTEIPILEGLIGSGMGKGPALALLLAGPALSLPSMLVIRSVIGGKKTLVYIALVIVMSTIAGYIFGAFHA